VVELVDLRLADQLAMTIHRGDNEIDLQNVRVRGDAIISHLKGDAELRIVDSVFSANLKVASDEGNDSLHLIDTEVRKNLTIISGKGNDELAIVSSSVGQLANLNTSSIGRQLFPTYDMDHVCLVDDVFGSLSVALGNDSDRLDLASTTVTSGSRLDGGTDWDTLGLPGSNAIAPGSDINFEFQTSTIVCDLLPDATLFTNPSDPLLLRVGADDGTVVEYFGQKNRAGLAQSLEVIAVQAADGTTIIEVDAEGRPTKLVAPTGDTFWVTWLSDSVVLASVVSADGTIQANAVVDLVNPVFAGPTEVSVRNRKLRGSTSPLTTVTPPGSLPDELPIGAPSTSLIDVTICGVPSIDSTVMMSVKPSSGLSFNVPAKHLGDGRYSASIPIPQASASASTDEICESVLEVLTEAFLFEAFPAGSAANICTALVAAIDFAAGGPSDAGSAIREACEAAFGAYQTAGRLNTESGIPGSPGIFSAICANLSGAVDRAVGTRYMLNPIAFVPGHGTVSGTPKFAPISGPFPYFSVRAGSDDEIVSFRTTPVDPGRFQGYVATVSIACPSPGTPVTLSIVGSDGYTDSVTFSLQGNSDVHLFVLGADIGVVDVITVTIDGELSRTISLALF
jgi:hypothetical protein